MLGQVAAAIQGQASVTHKAEIWWNLVYGGQVQMVSVKVIQLPYSLMSDSNVLKLTLYLTLRWYRAVINQDTGIVELLLRLHAHQCYHGYYMLLVNNINMEHECNREPNDSSWLYSDRQDENC